MGGLFDGPSPIEEKHGDPYPDVESDFPLLRITASVLDTSAYIRYRDPPYRSCILAILRGGQSIAPDQLVADLRSGRRCADFGTFHMTRISITGVRDGAPGGMMRNLFFTLQ